MASAFDPKKKSGKSVLRKAFDNLAVTGLIAAGAAGVAAGGVYLWDKGTQGMDTRTVKQIEEIKTEHCTKVTSIMTTDDNNAKPQAQQKSYVCESTSEFVIYTNDGNYDNKPSQMRFKSEEDVKLMQDKIHVGDTLDFRVSGTQITGKENILDVMAASTAAAVPADKAMTPSKPVVEEKPAETAPESKAKAPEAAPETDKTAENPASAEPAPVLVKPAGPKP